MHDPHECDRTLVVDEMNDAAIQDSVFDVFFSYSRRDDRIVIELVQALRRRGLKVFFDRDYLVPGQEWPQLLERHLRDCKSAAICLGPGGLGPWQKRELYVALNRQAQDQTFPVIPVLLPDAADQPLGFLNLQTWIDFSAGPGDPAALESLLRAVHGTAPADNQAPAPDPRALVCPYRGLEPFREEDEAFFVGHDIFVKALLEKIARHPLVSVVGASGSGKSSVVMAGLVPKLRRAVDGSVWDIAVMRPGQRPLQQLAATLLPPDPATDEFERIATLNSRARLLANRELTLADVVDASLRKQSGTDRFLLVIDQWEELYTQARGAGKTSDEKNAEGTEREDFLRVLLEASEDPRLAIVMTLRGDFFGHALENRQLASRLQDAIVTIGPMSREELRSAIELPAKATGLSFESGLVDQILKDVGNEPGNLPLLEFLLKELWLRRSRERKLTFEAYRETGGVHRAIAERAEAEYMKLGPEGQAAAKRILVRLVTPGEGQEDTRARLVIPQGDRAVLDVIDRFIKARLLTAQRDPATGRDVVEVGHEALIREWTTLKKWVDADREFLRTVYRVKVAMNAWEQETGDKTQRLLRRGRPLEEGRDLLGRPEAEVDDIRPFIEASMREDELQSRREQDERDEQQRKELQLRALAAEADARAAVERERAAKEREKQAKRMFRGLLAGAAVVLVLALAAVVSGLYARNQAAEAQANYELAVRGAAENTQEVATQFGNGSLTTAAALRMLDRSRKSFGRLPPGRQNAETMKAQIALFRAFSQTELKLGLLAQALASARTGNEIARQLVGSARDEAAQLILLDSIGDMGEAQLYGFALEDALATFKDYLTRANALAGPATSARLLVLRRGYEIQGDISWYLGRLQQAKDSFEESLKVANTLAERDATDEKERENGQRKLALSYIRLGDFYLAHRQLDQALEPLTKYLEIMRRLLAISESDIDWQRGAMLGEQRIGDWFLLAGKDKESSGGQKEAEAHFAEAETHFEEYFKIADRLAGTDRSNRELQRDFAIAYQRLGELHLATRSGIRAVTHFQHYNSLIQDLVTKDPENAGWKHDLANTLLKLGDAWRVRGDREQALSQYQLALKYEDEATAKYPANQIWQHDKALLYERLGETFLSLERAGDARKAFEACAALSAKTGLYTPRTMFPYDVHRSCSGRVQELAAAEKGSK